MIKVRIKKLPQARTGYQVQGALVNDVSAMGGADYNAYIGKPELIASKYITGVPRDQANLEAEGGETVYGDINGDGLPEHQIIRGPRHAQGGVPLSLPEDTFIFSDTRGMLIKDPNILAMFGKGGTKKSFTPAELAKQYDLQKYRKILEDPNSDAIERKSAELMMKKYIIKLGCLALAQESMKGFPQGIPAVAKPCMEARGLTEEQILPAKEINVLNDQLKKQMEQQENSDETMESEYDQNQMMQAQEMNQGQPVAQPQEQPMSQEEMMMYGGGMRRLRRAQEGMQQPSPEEMAMMEQQAQGQQEGGGQDEMMQIMQEVQGALERGIEPAQVVMSLLQNGLPPEAIVQIFTQMGASQEEAVGLIQEVMSQGQGGQEQGMGQQPMSEEEAMMMQQQQQAPPMAKKGLSIEDPIVLSKKDARRMSKGKPVNMLNYPTKYHLPHDSHVSSVNTLHTTDGTDGYSSDNSKTSVIDNVFPDGTSNTQYLGRLNGKDYYYNTEDGFARLNGEKIPINTKLNESIASGAGYVPNQRFGGTSMAAYGMSMGGYDMPFYDIPEAEYGMSMGSGMSQNYQGRPKRIPGGGPMFPLAKAQDGLNIDATNMTEDQLQRAIWDAQQKDKNAQITITRKDANGQVKTQKLKTSGFTVPKGEDITDLKGFPDTPAGRVAASQYMLIEQNLNNPTVRAEIIKNTKEALDNPDAWTGKSGTRNANNTWTKKYGSLPSDDEVIKQALNHQKRNLMFEANEVDPQLFTDVGNGLDSVDKVLAEKYINPKTGKEYTRAEATAELKNLKDDGYTSVAAMSDKLGVPLDPSGKDRVLQQGTMHGYAKAYKNFSSGGYDSNPDAKYAMDNFLGNVSLVHSGANDETSMGALYGSLGNKISPLDDKYDYANNNWYDFAHSSRGDSRFTTYGDTTAGHKYMVGKRNLEFEDIPEDPNCQCTDPSNTATYGKYKDADGNCSCTPPEDNPKKCPCQKSDGTVLEMTANADGTCPPCTEDKDIDVPGPAPEWWLQDTIKTTGAFGDLMGIKKHMPWAPGVDLETPRPTFLDPTRELAANAEQANIQTQGMAQFAGPQALSARSSGIQGQAAKNAADVLSKYNNANVNIANQFEMKGTDIRNQESMLKQATAQRLYDQNTVANQQFDNAKLAMRNNLRNYYTNAITNKEKTDALNQMYPNYAVSPAVGGRMNFVPTKKQVNGQGSSSMTMQEAMDWCKKNNPNATDHSACMDRVMNRQGRDSSKGSGANANAVNTMYPGQQMGGPVYEDGGFVHINSWLPFIL